MSEQQTHQVACTRCGERANVPFTTEGRPVLCESCFEVARPDRRF